MRAPCARVCRLGLCPDRVGSETQPALVAAVRPLENGSPLAFYRVPHLSDAGRTRISWPKRLDEIAGQSVPPVAIVPTDATFRAVSVLPPNSESVVAADLLSRCIRRRMTSAMRPSSTPRPASRTPESTSNSPHRPPTCTGVFAPPWPSRSPRLGLFVSKHVTGLDFPAESGENLTWAGGALVRDGDGFPRDREIAAGLHRQIRRC